MLSVATWLALCATGIDDHQIHVDPNLSYLFYGVELLDSIGWECHMGLTCPNKTTSLGDQSYERHH